MSAAAGAPPPNQPPGGALSSNPRDKPMFNSWTENKKIKTCKCTVCDERVRVSSQKCDGCGRHVCSECLNPASSKIPYYKAAAQNRMEVGCWACNWRSNMNPAFARRKPAPEVRTEEERRARASKALGARRKAAAKASRRTAAIPNANKHDDAPSGDEQDPDSGAPEDDYHGPQSSVRTDRAVERRAATKRKRYVEADSESESFEDVQVNPVAGGAAKQMKQRISAGAFTKTTPQASTSTVVEKTIPTPTISPRHESFKSSIDDSIAPHLSEGATVVIGAGIVGLFTAYELALNLYEAGITHEITVVEIRSSFCGLASGACTGIINASDMPDLWTQIAMEAESFWHQLREHPDSFSNEYLGYESIFDVKQDAAIHGTKAPSWFRGAPECSILEISERPFRIDTLGLASWLYEQCKALNVNFLFNHNVYDTKFATNSALSHVYIEDGAGKQVQIHCQNLVIAAGPFSTGIFNSLFGNAAVELENHINAAHCLHVVVDGVGSQDKVALRFPDAASNVSWLESAVTIVPRAPNKTVLVSALARKVASGDLEYKRALQPRNAKTSDLRQVAAKYLDSAGVDATGGRLNYTKERLELSTANGNNPIIDRVPTSALGRVCGHEEDLMPSGIWLCYGFGNHGTALAPGAARILVSRILHGPNGIDNYDFSLPGYAMPKSVGKGKQKAAI